jgi:hypothetical protein
MLVLMVLELLIINKENKNLFTSIPIQEWGQSGQKRKNNY